MELILRRHLWVLDLSTVAICATLLALAGAGLTSTTLPAVSRAVVLGPSLPDQPRVPRRPSTIAERNIFCSDCRATPEPEVPRDSVPSEAKTSLPITLLAVMSAPSAGKSDCSIATMKDTESNRVGAFSIGSAILGARVTGILSTRVYLEYSGSTEYVDLLAPRADPSAAQKKVTNKDAVSTMLDRGIRKRDERTYDIRRGTLESVLGNLPLLARSVRPVPEIRNGKMSGFRLLSINPGSPLTKIGLRSGDILCAVNGLELTGTDRVVEAFGKLRSAAHLSVQLEREGKTIANDYTIR